MPLSDGPDIRAAEKALRGAGLTRRAARALLAAGWPAVVDAHRAEVDLLRLELEVLRENLTPPTIDSSLPDA